MSDFDQSAGAALCVFGNVRLPASRRLRFHNAADGDAERDPDVGVLSLVRDGAEAVLTSVHVSRLTDGRSNPYTPLPLPLTMAGLADGNSAPRA